MLFQPFQVTLVALVYWAVGGGGTLAAGCSGEYGSGRSGRRKRGGGLQHDEQRSAGKIKLWRSAVLPGAVMMSSIAVISSVMLMIRDTGLHKAVLGLGVVSSKARCVCVGVWGGYNRKMLLKLKRFES